MTRIFRFMRSRFLPLAVAAITSASVAISGCNKATSPKGADQVTFRTEDGFLLEGTVFGSGTKGVVLAHMFPADQSSWSEFAQDLEKRGFVALTFNFRGYGESEGDKDIGVIDRDVIGAIEFLVEKRGASSGVVLVGASMGGTASLIAGIRSMKVRGIAALSAPLELMGLDASNLQLGVLPNLKLFIAARDDAEAATAAEQLYKNSTPNAEIKIVPGSDHGTELLDGERAEEVKGSLIAFLDKAFE